MKRVLTLLLLLFLLAGCSLTQQPAALPEDELQVYFLDVGQADCIFLTCGGESMLIDGGNVADSQLVVSRLKQWGVEQLDYVVNTHAHEDHVGGLAGVLAAFEAEEIWCPVTEYDSQCFEDFLSYAEAQGRTPVCPAPGTTVPLGDAEITVLGPLGDYAETNNTSLVLRADFGETSFLFTGDAEAAAERDLVEAGIDLEADVLKAGHHGSDTSSSYRFLRAVSPQTVVISVGEDNAYGHPDEDALSRFRDVGAAVYRTDYQGEICCTSDGRDIEITTERYAAVTNPTEYDGSGQNSGSSEFIGNVKSKKFHLPNCSSLPAEENRITFSSYDAAVDAGYTPCGLCLQ